MHPAKSGDPGDMAIRPSPLSPLSTVSSSIVSGDSVMNPNTVPLGCRPYLQSSSPLPYNCRMARDDYAPSHPFPRNRPRSRSRSPFRPVRDRQQFTIHDDNKAAEEEWKADKANLYSLLEKLTLRLDTANAHVSNQTSRINDLEKVLKEKEVLVEQYQKRWRKDSAETAEQLRVNEEIVARCERFRDEIVRLSHEVAYLTTTIALGDDLGQLRTRCVKLERERDSAKAKMVKMREKLKKPNARGEHHGVGD